MAVLWLKPEDTIDPTGPFTDSAIRSASWILYKLTAEKYTGVQTSTEVYSLNGLGNFLEYAPQLINGKMYNTSTDYTTGNNRLKLRHSPVVSVSEVLIDGEPVPFKEFFISNSSSLVRKNHFPWLTTAESEISVTYEHGTPPPHVGVRAAIRLANEFIWAESDPSRCSLPERVTSVARQGISYTLLDPQSYISEGRTGIYEIDLFINAANPLRAKKRPRIYNGQAPVGETRT